MEKRVSIVDLHHQVLPFWAEMRRELGVPLAVLTLDYHTDILSCAGSCGEIPDAEAWRKPETVAAATARLRHDEHIDWALRAGIASRVRILHLAPQTAAPAHAKIELRRSALIPPPGLILNEPEKYRPVAEIQLDDVFLAPLLDNRPLDEEPFILDIDCDYFICEKALYPAHGELFHALCRRSAAVTLSRENDWVKLLKLPGETITGSSLAGKIAQIIRICS